MTKIAYVLSLPAKLAAIDETLEEISRVNQAAGYTAFNPAAREALLSLRENLTMDINQLRRDGFTVKNEKGDVLAGTVADLAP